MKSRKISTKDSYIVRFFTFLTDFIYHMYRNSYNF